MEYNCGMGIGLELGSEVSVGVMPWGGTTVITAMHRMQTQSSNENYVYVCSSVRPSVCQMRGL